MALVTLPEAKRQLRIPPDIHDHDEDINTKLQAASDIVIDYLKSRAHKVAVIATSSIANPTVVTTDEAHGYVTGETAVIVDHEDSVLDINGSHVVTVLSTTTFSIPIAVTVGGTGGSATVTWTPTNVPRRVHAATLLVLEDLYERRPIDWDVQRRLLERSRDPALA